MSIWQAMVLGLIQGLTEFLPVSSSGHLELGKALFGLQDLDLTFSILVHGATALSTIFVFWKDIRSLAFGFFDGQNRQARSYISMIALSMVPAALVAFTLRDGLEEHFIGRPDRVGLMLVLTGVILVVSQRFSGKSLPLNVPKALGIGLAQALAILPGISRSGSTIGAAIALGISRDEAARFSFLMALPVILGATALEMKDLLEASSSAGGIEGDLMLAYTVGTLVAFFSGVVACRWMVRLVQNTNLNGFALYCITAGIAAFFWF